MNSKAVQMERPRVFRKVDVLVIGAGQAGLSAAYFLKRYGLSLGKGFLVLDDEPGPGGAWQHRWDSLTLTTVNGVHDLPGLAFAPYSLSEKDNVQANIAVPNYFKAYEQEFGLGVIRPVRVNKVERKGDKFLMFTDQGFAFSTKGIINATGTWKNPNMPYYPGMDTFKGRQLHTQEYKDAEEFRGKHVLVIGGGISAVQLLGEILKVGTATWVTRRPPQFTHEPFTPELGSQAVALVEKRVRAGLPATSVVSVTGLPITPATEEMLKSQHLQRRDMFQEITPDGARWADGTEIKADVIFWNTGFNPSLDHLAPLGLFNEKGGITMGGRLATRVEADPRIHLVGYGPSASTIGANRAGRAAAKELIDYLGLAD